MPLETEAAYKRRLAKDAKRSKKLWGTVITGFGGEARSTALAAEKFNVRAALRQ